MGLIEPPELLRRHRLTVDEYHRMAEVGVLGADARVELIEGEVLDMAPMRSRHASVVGRLVDAFGRAASGQALVWCQLPLHLDGYSEPEPDLMLLRPCDDFYAAAHPTPSDVLLVVEVSESSARYDREIKLPLYAQHGVQEVWLLDLEVDVLRVYRNPRGELYTESQQTAQPGLLSPQALPGVVIDASKLLV
jgi:Uma2 family endonuclease